MSHTLGANEGNAKGYADLSLPFGYFMVTFENSLGNINAPTLDFMKGKTGKPTLAENFCIFLIYLFWWLAQITLLVVLLNFVIALIS
jgi:hypothetical protein